MPTTARMIPPHSQAFERGISVSAQNQRQKDLEVEYQNYQNDRMIQEIALADYQESQQDYLLSIGETLGKVVGLGYDSGQNYDDLSRLVDQYRDYIDVSDSDYATLKQELLKEYTPLEYRVTSYTYETETGGEGENGANIFEHTGYITWVKDKETDMEYEFNVFVKDLYKEHSDD